MAATLRVDRRFPAWNEVFAAAIAVRGRSLCVGFCCEGFASTTDTAYTHVAPMSPQRPTRLRSAASKAAPRWTWVNQALAALLLLFTATLLAPSRAHIAAIVSPASTVDAGAAREQCAAARRADDARLGLRAQDRGPDRRDGRGPADETSATATLFVRRPEGPSTLAPSGTPSQHVFAWPPGGARALLMVFHI